MISPSTLPLLTFYFPSTLPLLDLYELPALAQLAESLRLVACSHGGNIMFPRWECLVPIMGIILSPNGILNCESSKRQHRTISLFCK